MEKKHGKRTVLLINPNFQLRILAYILALALLVLVIFYAANYFFFLNLTNKGIQVGLPPEHVFFAFVERQKMVMNVVFFATSAIVFAVIGVFGLVLSHRIAGPIKRMQNHLLRLADGGATDDLSFRKKDFFLELADAFNKHMATYRSKLEKR